EAGREVPLLDGGEDGEEGVGAEAVEGAVGAVGAGFRLCFRALPGRGSGGILGLSLGGGHVEKGREKGVVRHAARPHADKRDTIRLTAEVGAAPQPARGSSGNS